MAGAPISAGLAEVKITMVNVERGLVKAVWWLFVMKKMVMLWLRRWSIVFGDFIEVVSDGMEKIRWMGKWERDFV